MENQLLSPGKAGNFTIAGPSKGPDRNRSKSKPRIIHCTKVLIGVIPAEAGIQFFLDSGSRFTCPE